MNISNEAQFPMDPILGESPDIFFGVDAPDGDLSPWAEAPIGSLYAHRNDTTDAVRWFQKMKEDLANNDWVAMGGLQCITETVALADFTDGGGAAGTYTMTEAIPVGAKGSTGFLVDVTGFAGDTSATIQVGDGSDVDRYGTGTPSVFADAAAIDLGVMSGTLIHATAVNPVITITSGADWGSVSAGQLTIKLFFYA